MLKEESKLEPKPIILNQTTTEGCEVSSLFLGEMPRKESVKLYKATLKGDWKAAEALIRADNSLVRTQLTGGGEIALHVAALQGNVDFVSKLLGFMEDKDLIIVNKNGCTSLCFAAAVGHTHIAKAIANRGPDLAKAKGENGILPLYMAALQGFGGTAQVLYDVSDIGSWPQKEQSDLLTAAISSQLYDLAAKIVNGHKHLAIAKDSNEETPLLTLARSPLAFRCNHDRQSLRGKHMRIGMKEGNDAHLFLKHVWKAMEAIGSDIEADRRKDIDNSFFAAAESGNQELLVELLNLDHNLKYKINESKHSILHIAVLNRYDKVLAWMERLGGTKDLIISYIDNDDNNLLHLAGKLPPQHHLNSIPSAVLQMQREVLWYKRIERLVPASFKSMRNLDGRTPHEVFLAEHDGLMREGEKFMKEMAKSCMIVSTVMAAVVFMTASNVPGGYDGGRVPILKSKKEFMVFTVSEAVAMLSSLSSVMMFLLILTSCYSDDDFLIRLPVWLHLGLASLLVTIVAMVVAFCSCLLFFQHSLAALALLISFASVATVFLLLKYYLLANVMRSTCNYITLFQRSSPTPKFKPS